MLRVKRIASLSLRLTLAFMAMLIAYVSSTMMIGHGSTPAMTTREANQAARALMFVSLVNTLR